MTSIFELKGLENAGVKRIPALEQSINQKLNGDGKWVDIHPLPLMEAMLRLTRLSPEESDYLGNLMGWDAPSFQGVAWDEIPYRLLAQVATGKLSIEDLRALYPAPTAAEVGAPLSL